MNEIQIIDSVHGYLDADNNVWLLAEDVAKGFGFTQTKNDVEYIRWETVNNYLNGFGFSQRVGKESYIPENMVYRLGFKANNEAAISFQTKLADDILPSIRKHGGYLTPQKIDEILSNPDTIIRLATSLKEERAKRKEAERINAENKPKVEFFDTVAESKTAIEMKEAANALNFKKVGRNKLFQLLRERGILTSKNQPYQKYVDCGYFRTIEQKWQTPDGDTNISIKTLVYQKGLDFIRKTLLKLGYKQLETEIA